jgi:tetratricopeptide (TPR) repeat protein
MAKTSKTKRMARPVGEKKGRPAKAGRPAKKAASRKRPARKAPARPTALARPDTEQLLGAVEPEASASTRVLPFEIEPGAVESALRQLREELAHWVRKGRYTRVRFKLRGKPVLPDVPVGALLAVEALSFWWVGPLRVLLVNLGAKALLEIELISYADLEVGRGRTALLAGDLDRAVECFNRALEMDRDCAGAWLNLGVARKLAGDREGARQHFQKAEQLDANGPVGDEARRLLDQL